MNNKICPLCKKNLALKQVNFNLAVYICEDLKCNYPVGYNCIIVEQKLEDMHSTTERLNEASEDWIDKIVTIDDTPSENITTPVTNSVEIPEDSIEWIDNLVEEAVNEVKRFEDSVANEITTGNDTPSVVETDFDEILNFMYSS